MFEQDGVEFPNLTAENGQTDRGQSASSRTCARSGPAGNPNDADAGDSEMDIRGTAQQLLDVEHAYVAAGSPEVAEIDEADVTDERWIATVGLLIAEEVPFDIAMGAVERNAQPIIAARQKGFTVAEIAQHALMTLVPNQGRNHD